jgi:light-regulated signal transduction histidine kinase (bacteriophytochrome)
VADSSLNQGPQLQQFAGYVINGASRMHELLQAILEFSRAGEPSGVVQPGDSGQAFERALKSVAVELNRDIGDITHDRLPQVMCSEDRLVRVWQNLLVNAGTYRSDKRPLQVHVAAVRVGGFWRFSVGDNGIGIKSEYLQQVFGMFKRLHKEEYPGVGAGLAVCKRIVESHGGRIWAESEFGHGTTIYFTLPAAAEDATVTAQN